MMSRRALGALAAIALLALILGALLLGTSKSTPPPPPARPAEAQPELMVLTSLPIIFPERLTLDAPPSEALEALSTRYRAAAISVADAETLEGRKLLLMAQPQAQPPEALVDLDEWVRRGGRLLLLADPALEWPSERPLADRLRPPFEFPDTGLLGHWGLRLDAPDSLGPEARTIDRRNVRTNSPGRLVSTGGNCTTSASGLIARCRLGKGRATVIADADFLNLTSIEGAEAEANFGMLLDELARLER